MDVGLSDEGLSGGGCYCYAIIPKLGPLRWMDEYGRGLPPPYGLTKGKIPEDRMWRVVLICIVGKTVAREVSRPGENEVGNCMLGSLGIGMDILSLCVLSRGFSYSLLIRL